MPQYELNTTSSIRTVSGLYVDVLNPQPDMFNIYDIAHSLSFQPRFGGHLPHFYSVAQHSWYASRKAAKGHELAALMHDASEFVMMDMPRPIKNHLTNYKELENNLMKVIAEKFNFQFPFHDEIKKVDDIMLHKEWEIMVEKSQDDPYFIPMSQPVAKSFFLKRFHELTNNHRDTIIQLQLDYGNKCAENKRLREALKGIKNIDDIDDEAWMIAHAALTPNNEQNNIK